MIVPTYLQVYRSVLLNNGPRRSPPPDTSSADVGSTENPPTSSPVHSQLQPYVATPLEEQLYRPDVDVGTRGDIIHFYNKVLIGFLKDFVLQFSPANTEVGVAVGMGGCGTFISLSQSCLWEVGVADAI